MNSWKDLAKVELHIHIEGALEPEMILAKAKKNNVSLPYQTVAEIKQNYYFNNVSDFLKVNHQNMTVLLTKEDFYDLTIDYLTRVHKQNVHHVEIFFNPQLHLKRSINFADQVDGINQALVEAKNKWNLTSKLIMCFLRNHSAESALEILEIAKPAIASNKVHGVGLSAAEIPGWVEKFVPVFKKAREMNLFTVCHAGEETTNENISVVLDLLKPQRIDHGIQATKDEKILARLQQEKIPLTLCPLSNQAVKACSDLQQFPLRTFLEHQIIFSLNSDSPAYCGSLSENYQMMDATFNFSSEEWKLIAINSIKSTFLSEEEKNNLIALIK